MPSTPLMPSCSTSFGVFVRIRPENEREQTSCSKTVVRQLNEMAVIFDPDDGQSQPHAIRKRSRQKKYAYDKVYGPYATQQEVYKGTVAPVIPSVLEGCNATIFAYGATGAGKTHTMIGNSESGPGLMTNAFRDLFRQIESTTNNSKSMSQLLSTDPLISDHPPPFQVRVSYLEVYNETIRDLLLSPASSSTSFPEPQVATNSDDSSVSGSVPLQKPRSNSASKRRETQLHLVEESGSEEGVQVSGLSWVTVGSAQQIEEEVNRGNLIRAHSPTDANALSSRSHAVLQVIVNCHIGAQQRTVAGKLCLIDLAGSERAQSTRNRGARMLEGANINRSLLALGNCINALYTHQLKAPSSDQRPPFIPYRDSKLTRLLKDSLSGGGRVIMIANISPSCVSMEDTHNTLLYASRAKAIKLAGADLPRAVSTQQQLLDYQQLLSQLRQENGILKQQLISRHHLVSEGETQTEETETQRSSPLDRELIVDEIRKKMNRLQEERKQFYVEISELKQKEGEHAVQLRTHRAYLLQLQQRNRNPPTLSSPSSVPLKSRESSGDANFFSPSSLRSASIPMSSYRSNNQTQIDPVELDEEELKAKISEFEALLQQSIQQQQKKAEDADKQRQRQQQLLQDIRLQVICPLQQKILLQHHQIFEMQLDHLRTKTEMQQQESNSWLLSQRVEQLQRALSSCFQVIQQQAASLVSSNLPPLIPAALLPVSFVPSRSYFPPAKQSFLSLSSDGKASLSSPSLPEKSIEQWTETLLLLRSPSSPQTCAVSNSRLPGEEIELGNSLDFPAFHLSPSASTIKTQQLQSPILSHLKHQLAAPFLQQSNNPSHFRGDIDTTADKASCSLASQSAQNPTTEDPDKEQLKNEDTSEDQGSHTSFPSTASCYINNGGNKKENRMDHFLRPTLSSSRRHQPSSVSEKQKPWVSSSIGSPLPSSRGDRRRLAFNSTSDVQRKFVDGDLNTNATKRSVSFYTGDQVDKTQKQIKKSPSSPQRDIENCSADNQPIITSATIRNSEIKSASSLMAEALKAAREIKGLQMQQQQQQRSLYASRLKPPSSGGNRGIHALTISSSLRHNNSSSSSSSSNNTSSMRVQTRPGITSQFTSSSSSVADLRSRLTAMQVSSSSLLHPHSRIRKPQLGAGRYQPVAVTTDVENTAFDMTIDTQAID